MASRRSNLARKQSPEDRSVPSGQTTPMFAISDVVPANFAALQDRLANLAKELNQAACDAAAVAAAPNGNGANGNAKATVTAAVTQPHDGKDKGMTATAPTTPVGTNAPTFNDLLTKAIDLGTQAGQGKDTQIKFDLLTIEAAYLGTLSLDADKHGKDRRDGIVLAEAYVKAQGTATTFDAKADKSRKLISNIDKCIKLGSNPKWGQGQPLQSVNELLTFRQGLRKDPAQAKKLDDAHNMLMRYATAQLKSDTLIDGTERNAFAFKKDPEERSVEDVLEGIRNTANKLKAGKIAHCPALDNSPEVQAIINAVTKRLTAIAKARGGQGGTP